MEPEDSLPYSQASATYPYPGPTQSSPHTQIPDPLLLRKSGSAGDRTRDLCICSQKLWPLDHRGGRIYENVSKLKERKIS